MLEKVDFSGKTVSLYEKSLKTGTYLYLKVFQCHLSLVSIDLLICIVSDCLCYSDHASEFSFLVGKSSCCKFDLLKLVYLARMD